MNRFIGFFFIVCAIPILLFIQQETSAQFSIAQTMRSNLVNAIHLEKPIYDLPITMKDRNDETFAEMYVEWRTPLPLSEIPIFAQYVFIESEDAHFYNHKGYDASAIVRAFLINTKADEKKQGASTITQQLIRMQYLSTDKTYERKVIELLYAAHLEKVASKEEILEAYLNEAYFANRVYGIGSAATYYFNKELQHLHPAEIAFLAAIPNNPKKYDPLLHFEATKERQERLLDLLETKNIITIDELNQYKEQPIELNIKSKMNSFPAYSDYVLTELEQLIADNEGFTKKLYKATNEEQKQEIYNALQEKVQEVFHSGIVIETALHPEKQRKDEQALNDLLAQNGVQAGAAVIDNERKEIISVYGGSHYQAEDFNRAYQAFRQPGSAFKPIFVYAPLFENSSYHERSIINSGPICIEQYCPKNVGGYVYGNTTIQEAFRHSHNTAAVRLLQQVGLERAFEHIEPFQFEAISRKDMVYAAALGGLQYGVTPLELASAYTSFIDGTYKKPHAIRAVKNREGHVIYQWQTESIPVWSQQTVTTMRSLLSDVVLNGTARGLPYTTAYTGVKTGTTNTYHDLWAAGLNEHYTAAVWLGYDQPSSIQHASDRKDHLKAIRSLFQLANEQSP